jgi:AcrR family transcriptional regulator
MTVPIRSLDPANDRLYAGMSTEQRRAERRRRLIAAAFELFGTEGYHRASIERICAEAAVSTRYFYEEFNNREDLLKAVYRFCCDESVGHAFRLASRADTAEDRLIASLVGYLRHATEDPRRARILHTEIRSVSSLDDWRLAETVSILRTISTFFGPEVDPEALTLMEHVLVGATNEAVTMWLGMAEPRPSVEILVEELAAFAVGAARVLAEVPRSR